MRAVGSSSCFPFLGGRTFLEEHLQREVVADIDATSDHERPCKRGRLRTGQLESRDVDGQ